MRLLLFWISLVSWDDLLHIPKQLFWYHFRINGGWILINVEIFQFCHLFWQKQSKNGPYHHHRHYCRQRVCRFLLLNLRQEWILEIFSFFPKHLVLYLFCSTSNMGPGVSGRFFWGSKWSSGIWGTGRSSTQFVPEAAEDNVATRTDWGRNKDGTRTTTVVDKRTGA